MQTHVRKLFETRVFEQSGSLQHTAFKMRLQLQSDAGQQKWAISGRWDSEIILKSSVTIPYRIISFFF